jgi:exodeoxyribonuclease-5
MAEREWSPEQRHALDEIAAWQQGRGHGRQIFRLFGFAGTGKTTITKEIARRTKGDVLFCAFTGKAALVMRQMGCDGAKTIHSAIYKPIEELIAEAKALREWTWRLYQNPQDEAVVAFVTQRWRTSDWTELQDKLRRLRESIEKGPQFELRDEIKDEPDVVICDECSMVNAELATDLLSFGHKVLVIGDPFQLPPVKGAGYFIDAEPDAMLTEVHRQAYGNPVTYLATVVRESGVWGLLPGKFGESRIMRQPLADSLETFLAADQVLCGRYATRRSLNAMIREAKGYDPEPMPTPGEKIICLRNNRKLGLLNGSMWSVVSCWRNGDYFEADIEPWDEADRSDDSVQRVVMHTDYFAGGEPSRKISLTRMSSIGATRSRRTRRKGHIGRASPSSTIAGQAKTVSKTAGCTRR